MQGHPDEVECHAEFVDGTYTYCGCLDCAQREAEDTQDHEDLAGPPDDLY